MAKSAIALCPMFVVKNWHHLLVEYWQGLKNTWRAYETMIWEINTELKWKYDGIPYKIQQQNRRAICNMWN